MEYDWSYFDQIRCINLITRDDRYNVAQDIFDRLQIPIKFFRTERHPLGGRQGCFESHVACLTEAYEAGANNCLIFEDDLTASSYITPEAVQEVVKFLQSCPNWDIFYLGTHYEFVRGHFVKVTPSIVHGGNICTHAYAASRSFMAKMAHMKYSGTEIDRLYVFNRNAYGVYPCFFYQGGSKSDISESTWDDFSGKWFWFRGVELYTYYVNQPLLVLLAILLILIVILYIINPTYRFPVLLGTFIVILLCFYVSSGYPHYVDVEKIDWEQLPEITQR